MQKIRFSSTIKKGVFMLSLLTAMGFAHAEKVSVGQQLPCLRFTHKMAPRLI